MRWDRLFEDLEDQLASEWEAERAALDTEAERLRLSRLTVRDRLRVLVETPANADAPASLELLDGTMLSGTLNAVGADWLGVDEYSIRMSPALVPLAAVVSVGLPASELLRSARSSTEPRRRLAERMSMGFVLRDLARRRIPVTVHASGGRMLSGTIDRAGADHLDLALHDPGAPRRTSDVRGYRLLPFTTIAWVSLDAAAPLT